MRYDKKAPTTTRRQCAQTTARTLGYGTQTIYPQDPERRLIVNNVRMFAKMLLALSFVPPDDVTKCFDELNDELAPMYDYYIEPLNGCDVIVERLQPFQLLCGICASRTDCHAQIIRYEVGIMPFNLQFHAIIRISTDLSNTVIQTEQDHTEQLIARFNAGSQTSVSSKNKYTFKSHDVLQLCCIRIR